MYVVKTTTLIFLAVYMTLVIRETAAGAPNIISRTRWGARAPRKEASNLTLKPAPYVIIHHSTGSSCETRTACKQKVKELQDNHMKRWNDIDYNFLVGEDGNIYEGRGWGKTGAHSVDFNNKSIGICIIGNYSNRIPKKAAVDALDNLISYGVQNGQIKSDYKLLGHKQTETTPCPGESLYTLIQSWPNWSQSE